MPRNLPILLFSLPSIQKCIYYDYRAYPVGTRSQTPPTRFRTRSTSHDLVSSSYEQSRDFESEHLSPTYDSTSQPCKQSQDFNTDPTEYELPSDYSPSQSPEMESFSPEDSGYFYMGSCPAPLDFPLCLEGQDCFIDYDSDYPLNLINKTALPLITTILPTVFIFQCPITSRKSCHNMI